MFQNNLLFKKGPSNTKINYHTKIDNERNMHSKQQITFIKKAH